MVPHLKPVLNSLRKRSSFVVSGTNLGMLLEGLMMRNSVTDSFEIAETVVQAGKSNIMLLKNNETEELPEEGI